MYSLIDKENDSYLLDVESDFILVKDCKGNSIKCVNLQMEVIWSLSIHDCNGNYLSEDENTFIFYESGECLICNKGNGTVLFRENRYYYQYNDVASVYIDLNDTSSIIVEIDGGYVKIPYQNSIKLFYSAILFQYNNSLLYCHSLTTGAELWKVDVGELGQWLDYDGKTMVPGVVKNVYPVGAAYVVTEVERSALACFEVETGRLVWRFNGPYTTHFLVAFYEDTFFVFSDSYYEIDALTGNVLRTENYIPIFNEAKVRPAMFSTPAISEKYIAISSHHDTAILLINRSTFTVEQRIALEGCKSGIPLSNAPRLYGNRLYQLDGDGTLHIFEEKE